MRLARPYSPLLQRLDVVEASIIPRHQYEGHDLLSGTPTRRPIGTGPFRFVSYAPGDRLVLERNPGACVIYDVKCTGHLATHILRHGGSPLMWKTGHSLI